MKTAGAIASIIFLLTTFVICFRLLLTAAQHDPGAYIMLGGITLLLVFAPVAIFVGISGERSGRWNGTQAHSKTAQAHSNATDAARTLIELTKHGDTWR